MNRQEILEYLDRPAGLSREERLIRLLEEKSQELDRLRLQMADSAGEGGSASEKGAFVG